MAHKPDGIEAYWFEGTQLYIKFIESTDLPACPEEPAIYEVRLLESGNLSFKKIEDAFWQRAERTAGVQAS